MTRSFASLKRSVAQLERDRAESERQRRARVATLADDMLSAGLRGDALIACCTAAICVALADLAEARR